MKPIQLLMFRRYVTFIQLSKKWSWKWFFPWATELIWEHLWSCELQRLLALQPLRSLSSYTWVLSSCIGIRPIFMHLKPRLGASVTLDWGSGWGGLMNNCWLSICWKMNNWLHSNFLLLHNTDGKLTHNEGHFLNDTINISGNNADVFWSFPSYMSADR